MAVQAEFLLGASRRRRWLRLAIMVAVIVILIVAMWQHEALGGYVAGLLEWMGSNLYS
jgi:hypothetical protein